MRVDAQRREEVMSGTTPPATVRTRKNVLTLGQTGDDLDWYAQAVAALKKLKLNDPTSWRYQAAVHGYPGHGNDPFAVRGEALPSRADQRTYWDQCQHGTWFFLPWHRNYLACFEEIVAATVVKLGGPPGWALPYWNYSDPSRPNARALPAAFLDTNSALWVDGRNMQTAQDVLPDAHVSLDCLTDGVFDGVNDGGDLGFGGPETGFNHPGRAFGQLENLPHNFIHDDIGGLMSDPDTAALDPIFWLHHANIDRLWAVWTHRNATFTNPTVAAWATDVPFVLHDSQGAVVKFTSSQMVDTTQVRHGYQYDDISDPLAPSAAPSV
jgi:tyrosinase